MKTDENLRLFVAVKTGNEIREKMSSLVALLKQSGAEVKWVKPENLHITLKFLGDVPLARLEEVKGALGQIRGSRFSLEIASVGALPNAKKPRVIFAGSGAGADRLKALAGEVETAFTAIGFVPEYRDFLAHLTLGRAKGPKNAGKLAEKMNSQAGVIFGKLSVDAVSLYKSDLGPHGPTYTILAEQPLE